MWVTYVYETYRMLHMAEYVAKVLKYKNYATNRKLMYFDLEYGFSLKKV